MDKSILTKPKNTILHNLESNKERTKSKAVYGFMEGGL